MSLRPGKFLLAAGIAIILAVGAYLFLQLRGRNNANADATAQTTIGTEDGGAVANGQTQIQVAGKQVLVAPIANQRKALDTELQSAPAPVIAPTAVPTAEVVAQEEQVQTQAVVVPTAIPATAVPATADPNSCGTGRAHTVAAGENVLRISLAYGVSQEDIRNINGLDSYYTIYPNQRLCLPSGASAGPASGTQGQTQNAGNTGECAAGQHVHVAVYGTTISGLAWEHGTTMDQIKAINGLTSDSVSIGQRFCIP